MTATIDTISEVCEETSVDPKENAMPTEHETFSVDPDRLADGVWSHETGETIGEGDIPASYSADRIGMGERIRKPFEWKARLWVCVSTRSQNGARIAEAYRLSLAATFAAATTYREKVAIEQGDYARNDPYGFYHGMAVQHGARIMVLCGPPALFVPDEAQRAVQQLDLFSGP